MVRLKWSGFCFRGEELHLVRVRVTAGGLPTLVRSCGRSPEHVAREFRRYFGQAPTQWVHSICLQHACILLETTDLSVTEVAAECGIESLSFFHRTFRSKYGRTPRQFRLATHGMVHPQGPALA